MAAISTENRSTREKQVQQESDAAISSGNDDKEKYLDCRSVRGDREPISDDEQNGTKTDDAKSFLRYDERSWLVIRPVSPSTTQSPFLCLGGSVYHLFLRDPPLLMEQFMMHRSFLKPPPAGSRSYSRTG